MIFTGSKFRILSENKISFFKNEADKPTAADEWTRRLNFIDFPIKCVNIHKTIQASKTEITYRNSKESSLNLISASPKTTQRIILTVDMEKMEDQLSYLNKGETHCETQVPKEPIEIEILESKPSDGTTEVPAGVHLGNICYYPLDGQTDNFLISMGVSNEQFTQIINECKLFTKDKSLTVRAQLFSYTSEMDDHLNDGSFPKDFLVTNSYAFLDSVHFSNKICQHDSVEPDYEIDEDDNFEDLTKENTLTEALLMKQNDYLKAIKQIGAFLLILLGVLIFKT